MALDPLSAVSLAAVIVQFVDFSSKIVSKGYRLYKATDGALPEKQLLGYVTSDLQRLHEKLCSHERLGCLTEDEQALEDLSSQCSTIADELAARLAKLTVAQDARHRKWKSFRQALKSVWSKEELDQLAATLAEYRNQLEFHVLLSMRKQQNLLEAQQDTRFERLDDRAKETIRLLQGNSTPFSEELKTQNIVIATYYREIKEHVTSEHERTRKEVIQAFRSTRFPNLIDQDNRASMNAKLEAHLIGDAILESLRFPTIDDRYHAIKDAYAKTFEWVFQPPNTEHQPWNDFSDWLTQGSGIYWINGKPGSGKSTLMRFIFEDARTRVRLNQWAGSSHLITAGFFFWKSGSWEQASQIGLLRSLLFKTLQRKKEAIKAVFPDEWETFERVLRTRPAGSTIQNPTLHWTARQLRTALQLLFRLKLDTQFCIFIDGLDEYNGDPSDTVGLFKGISSPNVKICLSSRPWVEFKEAFKSLPQLKLQDLTRPCIRVYVDEMLASNENMLALSTNDPDKAGSITTEIVAKAQGVFLWVILVVRSLLNGLVNGDRVSELEHRLKELPSDLKRLYRYMFDAIQPRYLPEGSRIFQMKQAKECLLTPPGLLPGNPSQTLSTTILWFALENQYHLTIRRHHPPDLELATELGDRCAADDTLWANIIDKRLSVCCAGLLEICPQSREASKQTENGDKEIDYIHRTAKDFLDTPPIQHILRRATKYTSFHPNTQLLKGWVMGLQKKDPKFLDLKYSPFGSNIETSLALPLSLAYYAEKEAPAPDLVESLATELSIFKSILKTSTQKLQIDTNLLEEIWPGDFTILAVRIPILGYLAAKFNIPHQIPRSPCGRSYLHYAVISMLRFWNTYSEAEPIFRFLLPHSSKEDVKEGWETAVAHISTIFGQADSLSPKYTSMWLTIFKLFLVHGADADTQCEYKGKNTTFRQVMQTLGNHHLGKHRGHHAPVNVPEVAIMPEAEQRSVVVEQHSSASSTSQLGIKPRSKMWARIRWTRSGWKKSRSTRNTE